MYKCGSKDCDEAHLFWIDCVNCLWDCSKWLQTLIKDSTLAVSGALWSMRGQFLPSAEWKRILVCPVYGGLTTWRGERGSVCRAARGAGRKTRSQENPPWTCQRSIKTADEWCRHTQAKTQVRQRIYVSALDGAPTDRSMWDTCWTQQSFPEMTSSNLIGCCYAAFLEVKAQIVKTTFQGFVPVRGILKAILLWSTDISIKRSVLITYRWKDILTAKSTHISNHPFAAVCLTICGDSCAVIPARYHTNLLLWFRPF